MERFKQGSGKENAFDIGTDMKKVMFDDVGIYRNEKGMTRGADQKVKELQETFKEVRVTDTGRIFNTELLNAWELGNMLEVAEVIATCALNRQGVARRALARGFPEPGRPELVEALAGLEEGRQDRDRLQAGGHHQVPTQGTRLLIEAAMQVTLKIFRYNPEVDKKFHYETYTLEADENERVLDLLEIVKGLP